MYTCLCICKCIYTECEPEAHKAQRCYGVALVSRLLKIIGLFCKKDLEKRLYSAKETYNLKEPTNHGHPISHKSP